MLADMEGLAGQLDQRMFYNGLEVLRLAELDLGDCLDLDKARREMTAQ